MTNNIINKHSLSDIIEVYINCCYNFLIGAYENI